MFLAACLLIQGVGVHAWRHGVVHTWCMPACVHAWQGAPLLAPRGLLAAGCTALPYKLMAQHSCST